MADLTVFFREIQRDEYFDSILARLSMKNLEKVTIQFEDQMKEILIGEICEECEEYPNQSMLQLINFDKFAGFSIDQIKMIISCLQSITEDHDYEFFFLSSLHYYW